MMKDRKKYFVHLVKLVLYANLGVIMFVSYILLQWAPNIHLLGTLTMAYTLAFGFEALVPLYVYVFLSGLYGGFGPWWIPYLYIWTVLWGVTMLLPRKLSPRLAAPLYIAVCGLHGLLFGVLYAPVQAIVFDLDFGGTIAWIVGGLPFDLIHAAGNIALGTLILPISKFLSDVNKKYLKV